MIASEKALPPSCESPAASPIPASTASIGSGTPITPVSATATRSGARPSGAAARPHIAQASARPCSPVSALALPALTTAARTAARSNRSRQIRTGAAAEALRVSRTAEATSSASQASSADVGLAAALKAAVGGAGAEAGREPGGVELLDAGRRLDPAGAEEDAGWVAHSEPSVSSSPSIRLRFWTPWPEAPFQMLSIAAKAITRPRSSTVT